MKDETKKNIRQHEEGVYSKWCEFFWCGVCGYCEAEPPSNGCGDGREREGHISDSSTDGIEEGMLCGGQYGEHIFGYVCIYGDEEILPVA